MTSTKFRKKSVVIEAFQPQGPWPLWATLATTKDGPLYPQPDRSVRIVTLEGIMTANPDDFIIKGVKGEFYPCKPDIFAATYEEVIDADVN